MTCLLPCPELWYACLNDICTLACCKNVFDQALKKYGALRGGPGFPRGFEEKEDY